MNGRDLYVSIYNLNMLSFCQDLFVGGTGTAAEAMQWTIAELMNNPEVFNKVREEIKSVVGTIKTEGRKDELNDRGTNKRKNATSSLTQEKNNHVQHT
jgi:cytochrome P450